MQLTQEVHGMAMKIAVSGSKQKPKPKSNNTRNNNHSSNADVLGHSTASLSPGQYNSTYSSRLRLQEAQRTYLIITIKLSVLVQEISILIF